VYFWYRPIFVSFAANAIRRKGCKMKIRIQHENKSIYLEVPDEDFTLMIDAGYEEAIGTFTYIDGRYVKPHRN
jgi:hypothetical protein